MFWCCPSFPSAFPEWGLIGWIHSHPSHNNFLSSIDQHTHYNILRHQPHAIAVVVSGRDYTSSKAILANTKIWTLSEQGILTVRTCSNQGLSLHQGHPKNHAILADAEIVLPSSASPIPSSSDTSPIIVRDYRTLDDFLDENSGEIDLPPGLMHHS
jgi:hypothetical protein